MEFQGCRSAATLVVVAAAVLCSCPALSAPPAHWSPDAINTAIAPGGHSELQATLQAIEALGNVQLRVTPALAPYVRVTPSTLTGVRAGASITIHILVQAAGNAPLKLFDGTIQVRQQDSKRRGDDDEEHDSEGQGRVFPRPLPVHVLIRKTADLVGPDTDGNGVWDYVDQYINSKYPSQNDSNLRAALRQNARALQAGLLHADDKALAMKDGREADRAIACLYFIRRDDAHSVRSDLQAAILNNPTRSRAYIMWSEQSAGQVFELVPPSQDACIPE